MSSTRSMEAPRQTLFDEIAAFQSHVGQHQPFEPGVIQIGVVEMHAFESDVPGHAVREPAMRDIHVRVHAVVFDLQMRYGAEGPAGRQSWSHDVGSPGRSRHDG